MNKARLEDNAAKDQITILICPPNFSASKRFTREGDDSITVKGFNAGALFGVLIRTVENIRDLSAVLLALEDMSTSFVIRGSPVQGLSHTNVRRTKKNFATPAIGRRWALIDIDKIALPVGLDLSRDFEGVLQHLTTLLPEEFHDVSYHYQLSSSAGMGDPSKVSVHLWFWLSEPWTDEALKTWAKAVNSRVNTKLIDPALFNDVQAHYTAAPIFEGVDNPFPVRSGLVMKGSAAVSIRAIEAPEAQRSPAVAGDFEPGLGFEGWLAKIGDHPGGEGFHEPIIRAIASYVRANGRDGTDPEKLFEFVSKRVMEADRSQHDDDYIALMASRDHIMVAIEGALVKYGDVTISRRRSRLTSDTSPLERPSSLSPDEAYKALSEALNGIIGVPEK